MKEKGRAGRRKKGTRKKRNWSKGEMTEGQRSKKAGDEPHTQAKYGAIAYTIKSMHGQVKPTGRAVE
jgi:hypothetical protein